MKAPRWTDLREVRRWATLRCEHCGHRFRWNRDSRHSFGNRDGRVYHGPCLGYIEWRRRAEERLTVLGLTCELSGLTVRDVTVAAELRATTEDERITASNRTWRVFYDLGRQARESSDSETDR